MIRIEDFLPNYPSITDSQFQQKLFNKEEFFRHKLARQQEQIAPGDFLNQQIIGAHYISPHTQYEGILVYHQQGVGKTCFAYAVAEGLRKSGLYKRCLVFARGKDLLLNIMRSFVYSCSSNPEFAKKKFKDLRSENAAVKKLLKTFYSFNTFLIFSRELAILTDEQIVERFSNTIIIIDEVHNIAADDLDKSVYSQFYRLFHLVKNSRKLIMSATPMSDDVSEIATIMNLLLPETDVLPTGKDFIAEYLQPRADETYDIRPDREGDLRRRFRGRISYLLARYDNITITYMGKAVKAEVGADIPEFRAMSLQMSEHQTNSYLEAYRQDTDADRRSIYNNSRQASLFVFPDGSWGAEGLKTYTNSRKGSFSLKDDFKKNVKDIEDLRRLSVKYANVIETIIANPAKNIYVYSSVVNGSGAKLLAQILELYGYQRCRGNEVTKGKRYILLTGDTLNLTFLVKYFNSARNAQGEYCQVIIGSKKISEGFSFFNIQMSLLLTFHWNYTETSQALRRAARYGSHRALEKVINGPIVLEVRQLAAIPAKNARAAIDTIMIGFSMRKDISIKRMERICQETSFDCPLNYERNAGDTDMSRDCNYQLCEYKCDSSSLDRTNQDYSTYELYYGNYMDLVPQVADLFHSYSSYEYQVMRDIINPSNDYQFLKCLSFIVENNVVLYNSFNYPCYLREKHNAYFLVATRDVGTDTYLFQSGLSVNNIILSETTELSLFSRKNYIQKGSEVLSSMLSNPPQNAAELDEYVDLMPEIIVDALVKAAAVKYLEKDQSRLVKLIINKFKTSVLFPKNESYVAIYKTKTNTVCFKRDSRQWTTCEIAEAQSTPRAVDLSNIDAKYIGIVSEDKFCIQDVSKAKNSDKRKRQNGAVCQQAGWPKARLIELTAELGIAVNEPITKVKLCELIREDLASKGLVKNGPCGTARKSKGV
jgi:Type III restriction enzyme, res subunit